MSGRAVGATGNRGSRPHRRIEAGGWYAPAIDADLDLLGRPPRASESPRANSRAALIDAALEEFSTKGYEAATVAGIAERAGVTTGALYAHFAGKLDLLLATVGLTRPRRSSTRSSAWSRGRGARRRGS